MTTLGPNPVQWIGYAYGRTLPSSMQEWVSRDLAGDHAVGRHMFRGMVPFTPLFAGTAVIPGVLWLHGLMVLMAFTAASYSTALHRQQNILGRLSRHGLPLTLQSPKCVARADAVRLTYEAEWRSGGSAACE